MAPFKIIAFDADDTLWHTERLYVEAQDGLKNILASYGADQDVHARLYATEMRNLETYGYGIKSFTLSMIETAIELSGGRISAADILSIIDSARRMITADVHLLEHVARAVTELAAHHTLMLITKGDLRDQESKVARSGLAQSFGHIEIVSDKKSATYRSILERYGVPPADFLMVGNSIPSDIQPVLELGASAVYIPHELTWAYDAADAPPTGKPGFHQLESIGELPALVTRLESGPPSTP